MRMTLKPTLIAIIALVTVALATILCTGFITARRIVEPADAPVSQSNPHLFAPASALVAEDSLALLKQQWTGDFPGMADRNIIRALVPYSKTYYFIDGIDQRGFAYEMLKAFEEYINAEQNRDIIKIQVVVIPTRRNRLLSDLVSGRGDIAAGNLTITSERAKRVDFTNPGLSDVSEILVVAPGVPLPETVDDLSGKTVYVRASSSYFESLMQINRAFKKKKMTPVRIETLDELLEDEDVLEMMNAGIIPRTVIDSHKAGCWSEVFEDLIFCHHIRLREDGEVAWAVRKNCPKLKEKINAFAKTHKKGTLMGNILFDRYLGSCAWISNPMEKDAFHRFENSVSLFKKYARKYDFDWVMIAALAYQESRINQNRKNPSGAVGVMQVLPTTAADPNVGIPDIHTLDGNIHAGVKYLAFLRDRYFAEEPMDRLNKMFFTLASYNAGPAKIARLREKAAQMNLNPDAWFENVEMAVAREIGRETVQYVSNIYKYYIAYRMIVDAGREKDELKKQFSAG